MGINLRITTFQRAQADGHLQRQNSVLGDALRCMVSSHGDDWIQHIVTNLFTPSCGDSAQINLGIN